MTGIEDSPSPNSAAVGVDYVPPGDDDDKPAPEPKTKAKTDPPPSKK